MSTPQPLPERFRSATTNVAMPREMLVRLMEFQPQKLPVVSLYLDARANQHGKHDYAAFVRKQMTEMSRSYEPHSPARECFDEDFVRIERYLEDGPRPATRAIAIVACSPATDFFDAGPCYAPFDEHRPFVP